MNKKIIFNSAEEAILGKVYNFSRKQKVELFLVGGIIRDKLLGRKKENPDMDFCLKKGAIVFGRRLARALRAGFVVLDKEHGACRLVLKDKKRIFTLDFTDFRGKTLEEDLLRRDFTINTMALALKDIFKKGGVNGRIIDLFGAREDLQRGVLRIPYRDAFDDDPLRMLRAFSFSCVLGCRIDAPTLKAIARKKKKILSVSPERIRDELFKILEGKDAFNTLCALDRIKILEIIIPEINLMRGVYQGPYHHLDIWKHTLECVKQFEELIAGLKADARIYGYCCRLLAGQRSRKALIKLALLFHDIGKPSTMRRCKGKISFHGHERAGLPWAHEACKRLKLSNDEIRSVKTMVLWHLRPGYLGDLEQISSRAKFRYFRDTADEALAVLLLSIADQRSTRGRLSTRADSLRHEKAAFSLINEYFRREKEKKPQRLVNGDDLMRELGLEPSPLIGKLLKSLEESQAIGRINSKAQALGLARRMLKKYGSAKPKKAAK